MYDANDRKFSITVDIDNYEKKRVCSKNCKRNFLTGF